MNNEVLGKARHDIESAQGIVERSKANLLSAERIVKESRALIFAALKKKAEARKAANIVRGIHFLYLHSCNFSLTHPDNVR
jgi:hypothetical protein